MQNKPRERWAGSSDALEIRDGLDDALSVKAVVVLPTRMLLEQACQTLLGVVHCLRVFGTGRAHSIARSGQHDLELFVICEQPQQNLTSLHTAGKLSTTVPTAPLPSMRTSVGLFFCHDRNLSETCTDNH